MVGVRVWALLSAILTLYHGGRFRCLCSRFSHDSSFMYPPALNLWHRPIFKKRNFTGQNEPNIVFMFTTWPKCNTIYTRIDLLLCKRTWCGRHCRYKSILTWSIWTSKRSLHCSECLQTTRVRERTLVQPKECLLNASWQLTHNPTKRTNRKYTTITTMSTTFSCNAGPSIVAIVHYSTATTLVKVKGDLSGYRE